MSKTRAGARRSTPIVLADEHVEIEPFGGARPSGAPARMNGHAARAGAVSGDGEPRAGEPRAGEPRAGESRAAETRAAEPLGRRQGRIELFKCPACKRQFWAARTRSVACAWCGEDQDKAARAANRSIAQTSSISHETLVRVLAASWQNRGGITSAPFFEVDERTAVRRGVVIAGLVLLVLVLGGAFGLE